jgi:hypothetical protein
VKPSALHQTLAALHQDVFQDRQYSSELTGAIAKAASLARIAEREAACTHPKRPVIRWLGSGEFRVCRDCGKVFGAVVKKPA